LVGGVPLNFGISARLGAAPPTGGRPRFVIEADEYDTAFFDKHSKFVHYRPRTAVLNNLEFDHADIFPDLAAIERQFHHLVRTVPGVVSGVVSGDSAASGRVVVNGLEESLTRVLHQGCWSEVRSFGSAVSDFSALGDPSDFEVMQAGRAVARVQWALSGVHNQLNALAAITAAEHVGVHPADAARALGRFQNVRRRMEVRGTAARAGGDITVYDDFAHHPTAIRTTLDGLRTQLDAPARRPAHVPARVQTNPTRARILAVFEPRSNTMKLGAMKAQLPWSLAAADLSFCHSAGLDWDATAALSPLGDKAVVSANLGDLVEAIAQAAHAGDHVVCMSNGGFGGVHEKLLKRLAED
jgi:UDP-N-acetylmuramate: L-alanyl-gamma-D-glutamyl-meso-diaminopimelate ligase